VATITEIISTKRSAHHAFIAWLCGNSDRPIASFNNIAPRAPPRLRDATFHNGAAFVETAGRLDLLLRGETDVILNFEGRMPEAITRWNEDYLSRETDKPVRRVAFLRDPVNTFASLTQLTKRRGFGDELNFFTQFLGFEAIAARMAGPEFDCVVTMAAWQRDEGFRRKLADFFGLITTALPRDVTAFGGGSSFGGRDFDPASSRDALFERWRAVEDDSLFLSLFADQEALAAIRGYFVRFGATEPTGGDVVERLASRAANDAKARRYGRGFLQPLRNIRGARLTMERTNSKWLREALRLYIRARLRRP
jgi:hypothetical protein